MPPKRKKEPQSSESESDFSDYEEGKSKKKKTTKKAPAKKTSKKMALKKEEAVADEVPKSEIVKQKSPAEFFAENQNIAGFDNPGKSLYTTIRELVENSLDASESISVLPDISLTIEEMTTEEFNKFRGMNTNDVVDTDLFADPSTVGKKRRKKKKGAEDLPPPQDRGAPTSTPSEAETDATVSSLPNGADPAVAQQTGTAPPPATDTKKKAGRKKDEPMYYRVTCQDNGVGMPHEAIPNMLGRVLSGSKYGVRQTRGKFGLGAKMALIWSKKSTGMPIEVQTGHSRDIKKIPEFLSHVVLDIDIYKNEPRVHKHEQLPNSDSFRGSKLTIVTGGSWQTYRMRILNYLQQLAIITPYAELSFKFLCKADPSKDLICKYMRRSNQMPPLAVHVKHHPSSVNNLLMRQLIDNTPGKKCKLIDFLTRELSCVDRSIAKRIIKELGEPEWSDAMDAKKLTVKQVHQLTQMLKSVTLFKPPDGSCLSPAGEYNLRLGIQKEMSPVYVATFTEKASAFEGHPFIVEAGVSIGGKDVKEGLNVFRFANRIPLLFEAGGDVVTRQATRINWSMYKIDQRRDKIGVFVSIVSTKIPFKGTGKEYIGDDIDEMKKAVKHALQMCCAQLRTHLVKRNALKEQRQRKKVLTKYIPDVSRAIAGVIMAIAEQREEEKNPPPLIEGSIRARCLDMLSSNTLSSDVIGQKLFEAVYAHDSEAVQEEAALLGRGKHVRQPIFLVPENPVAHEGDASSLEQQLDLGPVYHHPVFTFSLIQNPHTSLS